MFIDTNCEKTRASHILRTRRVAFRNICHDALPSDVSVTEIYRDHVTHIHRVIALHRPALMSSPGWLKHRINEHCAGTPWKDRLLFSLCIGAASGRHMLKAFNDLLMYSKPSRLVTSNQIVLAVLVLGIYVTKVPTSRMNESDIAVRLSLFMT
jgi:hypothetical protein